MKEIPQQSNCQLQQQTNEFEEMTFVLNLFVPYWGPWMCVIILFEGPRAQLDPLGVCLYNLFKQKLNYVCIRIFFTFTKSQREG